jgi:hypothetical protein
MTTEMGMNRDKRTWLNSWLLAALAFNLVFFLQELFLVVPKAFVPGLRPILYHNNHDWLGSDPISELLQGTGALVILIAGLGALRTLRRWRGGSATLRLGIAWFAFNGLFQSLPQLVIGAFIPQNDVARALIWLGFGEAGRAVTAGLAVLAMALAGRALVPLFRAFAPEARPVSLVFWLVTLPGLAAIPLIWLFRVPGEAQQVVLVPVLMIVSGLVFTSLGALWARGPAPRPSTGFGSPFRVLALLALLLLVFQLVLRPGIPFF